MSQLRPYTKSKIGSHLNYPIKFSEVRELLAPAIEQLAVEVWFWGWKPPRKNEQRDDYPVVEARYVPGEEQPWQLFVAPIPRGLRATVHPLLSPALSAQVRSWFQAPRSPGWSSTHHVLRIRFESASQLLKIEEHDSA
jgi:hypothetical protein